MTLFLVAHHVSQVESESVTSVTRVEHKSQKIPDISMTRVLILDVKLLPTEFIHWLTLLYTVYPD